MANAIITYCFEIIYTVAFSVFYSSLFEAIQSRLLRFNLVGCSSISFVALQSYVYRFTWKKETIRAPAALAQIPLVNPSNSLYPCIRSRNESEDSMAPNLGSCVA